MSLKVEKGNEGNESSAELERLKKENEALKKAAAEKQQSANQNQIPAGITAEQLTEILKVFTQKKDEEADLQAGVVAEKVPLEDIDQDGVVFYAPLSGYVISGDSRNGMAIKLPWGKKSIFFEHMHTKIIKTGKYDEVAPLSKYHSHSKREIEWLRNHSKFGVLFYESSPTMKIHEASKAARLADILAGIKELDLNEIVKRCNAEGVGINENIEDMKTGLAFKIFERELAHEKNNAKNRLEDSQKQALLLNKK